MGKYRTIVADPPWEYEAFLPSYTPTRDYEHARGEKPYQMLSIDEIAALPVATLAADNARVWCWATNRYLPAAFSILESWGFEYRQTAVWHKTGRVPPFGGSIAPQHSEYLIVGVRGKPRTLHRWESNVQSWPRGEHSAKPEAFLDLIEAVSPGPYLELFARRARFGWDYWGDESLGTAEMPVVATATNQK